MLSQEQLTLLSRSEFAELLSSEQLMRLLETTDLTDSSDLELISFLEIANFFYRLGLPIITDQVYDHFYLEELRRRIPEHEYLQAIEPEPALGAKTVTLPEQMLSTEKAYDREQIDRWLQRIAKTTEDLAIAFDTLLFRVTPKLDGYAAFDDGISLYTRGDGRKGTDITRVFERGLRVAGNGARGQGAGEVVVNQRYFNTYLAEFFENTRNFQASIIKEKELEQHALDAIQNQAAVFYPFAQLPAWQGVASELLLNFDSITEQVLGSVEFDVDGIVLEVIDPTVKQAMGATRHHHRWQIAFKNNTMTAEVKVLRVTAQTSRSGRVNPVAELEPTKLSGAVISRATAHHYAMVKQLGIGPGTLIELTRSGLVIPKIERVIIPQEPEIPDLCPSCQTSLVWDSDYLYCLNTTHCPAQIENSMEHFFRTLGNVDGFGEKTIVKLHEAGISSVYAIYQLTLSDLHVMGFGDKTAQNLLEQLQRSRNEVIEDWRFLGAFGIHRMGLGNCERLLEHRHLLDIFIMQLEEVVAIEGFAEKTATAMLLSLQKIKDDFMQIYQLGFNLKVTLLLTERSENQGVLFGKTVVFTGTMQHGSREDMQKYAKSLGAKVATAVTGNTDYLIVGEKVGANKLAAAQAKGVAILTESAYLQMLN